MNYSKSTPVPKAHELHLSITENGQPAKSLEGNFRIELKDGNNVTLDYDTSEMYGHARSTLKLLQELASRNMLQLKTLNGQSITPDDLRDLNKTLQEQHRSLAQQKDTLGVEAWVPVIVGREFPQSKHAQLLVVVKDEVDAQGLHRWLEM